ncbi:MAG: type VI secretion system tip protein VgrG [Sedimentitalea sp.]|nr:type VI secretion system tip protein VgrG [Sedimentitalea sp.]
MADSPLLKSEGPVGVTVRTNGAVIADSVAVLSVRVRNEIGRIPEALVVIEAGSIAESDFPEADGDTFKVGSEISVAAFYGSGDETELFKGLIVAARMRIRGGRGPRLELTCRDKAAKMTVARKSALYEAKKDSDVVTALISEAGLTADVAATAGEARDQVRHDCTDWDFLRALADRNGQILTVWDGKITCKPPDTSTAAVLTLTLGIDIIEFDAQIDTQGLIGTASGKSWDDSAVTGIEASGGALPATTWGDLTSATLAGVLGDRAHLFTAPLRIEAAEIKAMADARLMKSAMSAVQGTCAFQGSGLAKPGAMLELTGVGDRFGGSAFVSGVLHRIGEGSWITEATLGLPDGWLSDSAGLAGAGAAGITAPIHGVQVATVVKIDADPDSRARIQVELPMIGETPAKVWARYAQPYATKSAGIQFMPEIGDEVLVAFLNADPNGPVVIGSVHNGTNAQANAPDETNTLKTILTNAKLKIQFDDDKKIITVETPGGHALVMDDDAKAITMTDSTGNKIEMSESGIAITSPKDISITATGNVDVTATGDASVGGANVTAEADMQLTAKGGAGAEFSAGGQTVVKGAMVMIN